MTSVVEGIAATGVVAGLVVAAGFCVAGLVVATGIVVAGLVVAATDVVVGLAVFSGPNISPMHGFLVFLRSLTQFVPTLVKFTAQSQRHDVSPLTQHPLYVGLSHCTHPRSSGVQVADRL